MQYVDIVRAGKRVRPAGGVRPWRGATPAQVALAWILRQPGVTAPIVGTTRLEHLDTLVAALDIGHR